jgi:hypothetical protein
MTSAMLPTDCPVGPPKGDAVYCGDYVVDDTGPADCDVPVLHIVPAARVEYFKALIFSRMESFRALNPLARLEGFRDLKFSTLVEIIWALKYSNLATGTTSRDLSPR